MSLDVYILRFLSQGTPKIEKRILFSPYTSFRGRFVIQIQLLFLLSAVTWFSCNFPSSQQLSCACLITSSWADKACPTQLRVESHVQHRCGTSSFSPPLLLLQSPSLPWRCSWEIWWPVSRWWGPRWTSTSTTPWGVRPRRGRVGRFCSGSNTARASAWPCWAIKKASCPLLCPGAPPRDPVSRKPGSRA